MITKEEMKRLFESLHCGNNKHTTRMNEHGNYVIPATQDAFSGFVTACEKFSGLVVMMFNHDDVPVFTQGYQEHECLDPVTADFCNNLVSIIEEEES